jgi:glycine oxidase
MPVTHGFMNTAKADVVVIGDGVIGLSTAFELGRVGASCLVFGAVNQGAASGAAAGLLAPSIGTLPRDVQAFFDASLALYPDFVDDLRAFEPELVLLEGLLDVSEDGKRSVSLVRSEGTARLLSARDVALLEPALSAGEALFHQRDGAIDNGLLVRALRRAVAQSPSCTLVDDPVASIEVSSPLKIQARSGAIVEAETVVVSAGAWTPTINGLPRRIPVSPLKGQMLAVASTALQHAVMGDDIYLVPRRGEIAIGATAERAGFDTTVVPNAIEQLRQSAIRICPILADAPVTRSWAGIRPATPDMLPIIGPDPANDRLLYACGHSKNGILLAPATARCIAALATASDLPLDIAPFGIMRFSSGE